VDFVAGAERAAAEQPAQGLAQRVVALVRVLRGRGVLSGQYCGSNPVRSGPPPLPSVLAAWVLLLASGVLSPW